MVTTLTDQRPRLWLARRYEQDRLILLREARAKICGCLTCSDEDRLEELDVRIRRSQLLLDELTDRITDRTDTPCSS